MLAKFSSLQVGFLNPRTAAPCSWAGRVVADNSESGWQLLRHGAQRHSAAVRSHIGGAGALGPPVNGQLLRVISAVGAGWQARDDSRRQSSGAIDTNRGESSVDCACNKSDDQQDSSQNVPPLLRVKLSVHYRVHSRQMLCIGGNQIPFGWSFMSIAKVPMEWSQGDIWSAEFDLPANSKMEYKYVIMEEQDWTTQVSEDSEGVVSFSYRTEPDAPPDVRTIQKQMAIVAWQPGPNRTVILPRMEEWRGLSEGEVRPREVIPQQQQQQAVQPYMAGRLHGRQALGGKTTRGLQSDQGAPGTTQHRQQQQQTEVSKEQSPPFVPVQQQTQHARQSKELDPPNGTWETLQLRDGVLLLERRDVWGLPSPLPRSRSLNGFRLDT